MNRSDRGLKHVCTECMIKYYDLKKEVVACPKCGANPPAPRLRRAAPSRKGGRTAFGRHL